MATDLLLIPGLLSDHGLWAAQVTALADLARGRTAVPSAPTIPAMADEVLSRAPERFALAGFSLGGCVALEVWARAADRVERLALLSTNAAGPLPAVRRHYEASIAGIEAEGLDGYLAAAFPRYVAPEHAADRALFEAFAAMGRRVGAETGLRQMRALLDYRGFEGSLGAIECPTMLACGRDDQRTPVAVHAAMAAQIRGAQLTVIERSGHFTALEQPAALGAALRAWLSA